MLPRVFERHFDETILVGDNSAAGGEQGSVAEEVVGLVNGRDRITDEYSSLRGGTWR